MSQGRTLVVTGASSGIGRAIAVAAVGAGWRVLGTVRRVEDAQSLAALGIASARLDLLDPPSVVAGCAEIVAWCDGRLDALVNNAGSTWPAPIELTTLDDLRAQFELNVVGQVHLTQRLLDALRAAHGRVVFISSDSTVVAPPMVGAYAASKRAIEAIAESLAVETLDQGLTVIVVSPGPYDTAIWGTSTPRGEVYLQGSDARIERYRALAEAVRKLSTGRPLGDPRELAAVVLHALTTARPRFRYVAPLQSRLIAALRSVLPTRWWHRLLRAVINRA